MTKERNSQSRDGYFAGHKWTEYFDVSYGEVVDNPDYDPDAEPWEPNSNKHYLKNEAGIGDHGNFFRSAANMNRIFASARLGYVYDDDGNQYKEYTKKGRWVYYSESERIKCEHRLLSEVTVGDNRLAKDQTYKVEVWWKLDHLTWSKDKEDFVLKSSDWLWLKDPYTLSAISSSRTLIDLLEENTRIYELEEKGSSQIWWEGRAVKPWLARNYIVWEREQHDELNSN